MSSREDIAREALAARIRTNTGGLVKLVNFQKTNAIEKDLLGVKLYEVEYEATIEFQEDCMWGFDRFSGELRADRGHYQTKGTIVIGGAGNNRGNQGQTARVSGRITLQKTENGWRAN